MATVGKVHLFRWRVNSIGYDNSGAYWGIGKPLYRAYVETEHETETLTFRASTRYAAKLHVRELYPDAKFYR